MPKRINKTKDQLIAEMQNKSKIDHQKFMVRTLFPLLETQESIYDAQTAVNALSGFIKYEIEQKESEMKVSDLDIDLSKEKSSVIKSAVVDMLALVGPENAKDTASLLEKVGSALAQFGAAQFLKNPMTSVKITDIVAE